MKKIFTTAVMLLAAALILNLSAFTQLRTGGYKTAETDNARVVAAANFAVEKRAEMNLEQEKLTLDSIDKAETQSVAGTNFRLCLTINFGEELQQVEAVVFQNLQQEFTLKNWTFKDCAEKDSAAMTSLSIGKSLSNTRTTSGLINEQI